MKKIENEKLEVTVSDHGAELYRIFDKEKGREVLWDGNPGFWNRRAPILFPFVGKCYQNVYRHNGREYPMNQHGFARDMDFKVTEHEETEVLHQLTETEETLKVYPFLFLLQVGHRLTEDGLEVSWTVKNTGEERMYFSIGGHPAFRIPEPPGKPAGCFVRVAGQEHLNYVRVDLATGTAVTDKVYEIGLDQQMFPVTADMFDQDALIFDDEQIREVSILLPDQTPYVTMRYQGFSSTGIWSRPGAPFICLEPWIGRCDNYGFTGELKDKYTVQMLEPGTQFQASYRIIIH